MTCKICGGEIDRDTEITVKGYYIQALPTSPCSKCGVLHWNFNGTPAGRHNDNNPKERAYVTEDGESFYWK